MFTACGNCTAYNKGAGSKACLTCNKYKEITQTYQDRDTIRIVSLPQMVLEAVGDSHHKSKGIEWAMKLIDIECLAVVLLRHYGGRTIKEIAEGLKMSEATVSRRLAKGNEELKNILNEGNSIICDDSSL